MGTTPKVYVLTQAGADLIGAHDWTLKDSDIKEQFLSHLLRTNDVRIAIMLAVQDCGGELRAYPETRIEIWYSSFFN